MKKFIRLFSLLFIFSLMFCQLAQAQLLKRRPGGAPPVVQPTNQGNATGPAWQKDWPEVKNQDEDRYDINRDGKLQTAEVKIYLRDVIKEVMDKGGFRVNSNVLKAYDKNRDGVISKYELEQIRQDVNDIEN